MRHVSDFLLMHRDRINHSSLMADQLIIEFKESVTSKEMVSLFADLITFLKPVRAIAINDRRTLRLYF